ncbi:MAG: phosphoribosylamine--glycine ligase, partial [Candidatus Omnitrophica bacterium]|nr:phosphoribosylamine--glycine ligase [Candidatus Omnitrophota bacterium]
MRVLVVGSGGREHALIWKLSRSPEVTKLFCAPGNGGIGELADLIDVGAEDVEGLAEFAENKDIDLTVVGQEAALAKGIVDLFEKRGLRIFGPTKAAARLESSKAFAKNLMKKYHIPTSQFAVFDDPQAARAYVRQLGVPIVVKADGLCGGKGTIVAQTLSEALGAIDLLMEDRIFKQAGERIVVEERLVGEEVSIIVVTDGVTALPLLPAQDHKRLHDGDKGPNTGGMGAYAPAPLIDAPLAKQIMEQVITPTIRAMASEGLHFKGVLYAGLMMTSDGPKVLEYNVRFGDPEIQAILPLLKSDLVPILDDTVEGRLSTTSCEWEPGSCACVVIASNGYPGDFQIGKEIRGLESFQNRRDLLVLHAGTKKDQ